MTKQQEAAPLTVSLERIADCMEDLLHEIDNLVGIYKASLLAAEDAPEKGGRIEDAQEREGMIESLAAEDAPEKGGRIEDAQEREGMIESLARKYIDAGKEVNPKAIGTAIKSGEDVVALHLCRIGLREDLPDQWKQKPTTPKGMSQKLMWKTAYLMHKKGASKAAIALASGPKIKTIDCYIRRWKNLVEVCGDKA